MGDFIPHNSGGYNNWLKNLIAKILTRGPQFGLTEAQVTAVQTRCQAQLDLHDARVEAEKSASAAIKAEKDGEAATNAFLRAQIANWKTLAGFTNAIAVDLGAVATGDSGAESPPAPIKPTFKLELSGPNVLVIWVKGRFTGVNVYSRRRGEETFVKIGMDTSSPYLDSRPNANGPAAEVREYMLRYMLNDEEVGVDSDIMSIAVKGL